MEGLFYLSYMASIRLLRFSVLMIIMTCGVSACFLLKPFVYTDRELAEHYAHKKITPEYKQLAFLNKKIHYAKISVNDSLPLLVFIHGAPGAWYGYMNLMDDTILQKKFKMIAIDRMGYGKSNPGKAELSTQLQALSVLEVIHDENNNDQKVTLLGRSYGSPIAAWIAIRYPQLVNHLYMVSPVIDPAAEKFFWFSGLGKTKVMQALLPSFMNVATHEKYAHVAEMTKMLGEWRKLFVPTTVLCGENDHIADTANYSFAKSHLLNCAAQCLMLKNTGHLITYEKAELVRNLLLRQEKE